MNKDRLNNAIVNAFATMLCILVPILLGTLLYRLYADGGLLLLGIFIIPIAMFLTLIAVFYFKEK